MRNAPFIATLMVAMALWLPACKPDSKLIGKWQGYKFYSPSFDSFINAKNAEIDTAYIENNPAKNLQQYGTNNPDSIKLFMHAKLSQIVHEQYAAIENTSITFTADSLAFFALVNGVDTSRWRVLGDTVLALTEQIGTEKGQVNRLPILKLTPTDLQLEFDRNGDNSIVSFRKVKGK